MNQRTQEHLIGKLDVLISIIGQAVVLDGLKVRERKAYELLKDARLLILEELEGASEREKTEETSDEELLEAFISKQQIQATLQKLEREYFEAARKLHDTLMHRMGLIDAYDFVSATQNHLAMCDAVCRVAEVLGVRLGDEKGQQETLYKYHVGDCVSIVKGAHIGNSFVVSEDGRKQSDGLINAPMYYWHGRWYLEEELVPSESKPQC